MDADNLYWVAGTVNAGPLDGRPAVVLDSDAPYSESMTLDSTSLYWTNDNDATV